jgi:hypothetical protein
MGRSEQVPGNRHVLNVNACYQILILDSPHQAAADATLAWHVDSHRLELKK